MTSKSDYTDEEWARLVRGPIVAGLAISIADPGGPIDAAKEMLASIRVIQSPAEGEPLLNEIARHVREKAERRENPMGELRIQGGAMAGDQVLQELRAIDRILTAKATPPEATAYRSWLLHVAQATADAAKEGGFLGFGAERISEGERMMLERVRQALGMDSPAGAAD
jgi:hypothetical protein